MAPSSPVARRTHARLRPEARRQGRGDPPDPPSAKPAVATAARPPPPAQQAATPLAGRARRRARHRVRGHGHPGAALVAAPGRAARAAGVRARRGRGVLHGARRRAGWQAAAAGRRQAQLRVHHGGVVLPRDHWRALRRFLAVELFTASRLAARAADRRAEVAALVATLLHDAWGIHRDPKLWEAPEVFRPERFLDTAMVTMVTAPLLPFGLGRRRCPGEGMAMRLMGLTLAALVQCFDWDVGESGAVDMTEGAGLSMPMTKPLAAICRPREIVKSVLSAST